MIVVYRFPLVVRVFERGDIISSSPPNLKDTRYTGDGGKGIGRCWKSFYEHQHTFPSLLAIPLTTSGMFLTNSPPLELHSKRTKGARPPWHFSSPTNIFRRRRKKEGKIFLGRGKCLRKNEGYDSKWRTTWRMREYKYTPRPIVSTNVVCELKINSQADRRDKLEHQMSIQRLEAILIIVSTLGSWSSHPRNSRLVNRSDDCSQN